MTISPPSKVKLSPDEPARVLCYGIDSLVLALDVLWDDRTGFDILAALKASAMAHDVAVPGVVDYGGADDPWIFKVLPHGAGGHEWVLVSHDMTLKIGNWLEPMSRPSVMAEFRSEALWTHGPEVMLERVRDILAAWGGAVVTERVSRCDVCVDTLLPSEVWNLHLLDQFVTRALDINPFLHRDKLTGFQIGKGAVMARLYDKVVEINKKSHKFWMFDVWDVHELAPGYQIIRVEFQLRREPLKRLGVGTLAELLAKLPEFWAYCTQSWLKVRTNKELHHTQQRTLPWWEVVQAGVSGAITAHPCIRRKAIGSDTRRLLNSILGYATSYAALMLDGSVLVEGEPLELRHYVGQIQQHLYAHKITDEDFTAKVKIKQAERTRARQKWIDEAGA